MSTHTTNRARLTTDPRDVAYSRPFRVAHRGAGSRYVATTSAATLARRVGVLVVFALALTVMALAGRSDVQRECFSAMHTDVVSAQHTDTVATCVARFGSRGY